MIQEFKDFIAKGNVMDMAVGIIIGAAFTAIVTSLVGDLINPIIALFTGGIDAEVTKTARPADSGTAARTTYHIRPFAAVFFVEKRAIVHGIANQVGIVRQRFRKRAYQL